MIDRISPNARYAQAVRHAGLLYIAGQIADDRDGDIQSQTKQVLSRIDALLNEAGSDRSKLLSCTVWISDFADYDGYNLVWQEWIGSTVPARASVGAALLDSKLRIEIAAVAACSDTVPSAAERVEQAKRATPEVDPATLEALQAAGGTLVLDVRDSSELESGMVPGSVHAPRGTLEFLLDPSSEFFLPAVRDAERVVFVCRSGGRAALAAQLAKEMGWPAIRLAGGMKAWHLANEG